MTFSSEFGELLDSSTSHTTGGRGRFIDALSADLSIALAQGERLAVLLVDLRRFLAFNLAHGYEAGDEVLLHVPAMLQRTIRKASAVERIGDNCFAMLVPALSSPALLTVAAERIRRALSEPWDLGELRVELDCHIASAVYPEGGQLAQDLLLSAERVLADVKRRKFSDPVVPLLSTDDATPRWDVEALLREAIDRGELELHYQPKVRLHDQVPASAEALLRWNSAELGQMRPDEFIAIAEESTLINQLTKWALKTAVREGATIAGTGTLPTVAVNVSATDIYDRGMVHDLETILAIWGISPEHLTVEVTESVIMDSPELALRHLEQIRDLGVRVSLDDFGTGYSSLAYFKSLPLDEIKIDRSFIQNLCTDADDAALVEAIINLAHKFNLSVVAEGVEDARTLHKLVRLRCDYAQGYHFSRPIPLRDFASWLEGYEAQRYWQLET